MRILTAGPWVGEFGWELFCWQASLRALSRDFDKTVISSRPGHEALYADFCDQYIPHLADVNLCSGRRNFTQKSTFVFNDIKPHTHISAKKLGHPVEFIKFGKSNPGLKYDIVMHARGIRTNASQKLSHNKMNIKASRNWELSKWNDLAERLIKEGLTICSIGSSAAAYHVRGTASFLDAPLSKVVDVFSSSSLAIGPSSGPMHLASLCGTPHFVWTAKCNIKRYNRLWNPLETPVQLLVDESWNPSVDAVFEGVMKAHNDA